MKILIVDDEMLAREVLKTQLEALHYQNIKMATDGKSALLSLRDEIPDVIFLDICMPEMSGIEFMEQAANHKKDVSEITSFSFYFSVKTAIFVVLTTIRAFTLSREIGRAHV